MSVLACNLLMAAYEEDENWPEIFVKVGINLITVRVLLELSFNYSSIVRYTSRILWAKGSGLTVLTARTLLTTSRLLLGRRCPLRVCCCRLTLAALVEISVPVGLHLGSPQASWVLKTNPGWSMQCVCVFRQQSSSFNTRWRWLTGRTANRWGKTQSWRWRADHA